MINKLEFENIIDDNSNQLFILSSPVTLPLSFARHLWIVINLKGKMYRYEVKHSKNFERKDSLYVRDGYVYRDITPPASGLGVFTVLGNYKFSSRLEHVIKLDDKINFEELNPPLGPIPLSSASNKVLQCRDEYLLTQSP